MTVSPSHLPKALQGLKDCDNLSEVVVLSTCNRTEIYAHAERFHGAVQDIRNFLGELALLAPEDFADHLYTFHDAAAVAHLFMVTSGLDSAVLGEGEVLGQVKGAWEASASEGATGPVLNMLFRHAIEAGKRVRNETDIAKHHASVSQAAVSLATERLGTLEGAKVLVLGAGEMGEGMVMCLSRAGAGEVLVANRTDERAESLASRVGGRAIGLSELPEALSQIDVLLTSTGATSVLVEHADIEPVMASRNGRELLIVDVAVPRDVDPYVGELEGVTLLDMDDLRAFAQIGLDERRREVSSARDLVDEEVARYREVASAREVAPLVTEVREHFESLRIAEVERVGRRLGPAERDALDALSRSLVAKMLHEPTVRLKDAAGTPRGERLAEALRELFGL